MRNPGVTTPSRRAMLGSLTALVLLLLGGCVAPEPRTIGSDDVVPVPTYTDLPIVSGGTGLVIAEHGDLDATSFAAYRFTVVTAGPASVPVLAPISSRARRITDFAAMTPIRPGAELAWGVSVGVVPLADEYLAGVSGVTSRRSVRFAVGPGITTRLGLECPAEGHDGHGARDAIGITPYFDADRPAALGIEVGLHGRDRSGELRSEILDLDVGHDGTNAVVLLFSPPFREDVGGSLIVTIERETDAAEVAAVIEDCIGTAAVNPAMVSEAVGPASGDRGWSYLRRGLGERQTARSALLFLAVESGARLTEDLALAADDSVLEKLALTVRDLADETTAAPAGIDLERAACRVLAELHDADELPIGAEAMLVRHVGALARDPGAMTERLAAIDDVDGMTDLVVSENLLYLEDTSPAARVRAYDWLAAAGHTVVDYDPLDTAAARRAALERHRNPPAAEASSNDAAAEGGR